MGISVLCHVSSERTRENGLRLHTGRFRLDIRFFFSLKQWSDIGISYPGRWLESLSLEVIKRRLDMTLEVFKGSLDTTLGVGVVMVVLGRWLDKIILKGFFQH